MLRGELLEGLEEGSCAGSGFNEFGVSPFTEKQTFPSVVFLVRGLIFIVAMPWPLGHLFFSQHTPVPPERVETKHIPHGDGVLP